MKSAMMRATARRSGLAVLGVAAFLAAAALVPDHASASEAGPGFQWNLGLIGGTLQFLGAYPFVLLFTTLALGTALGRVKLGFLTLGSTAATLLMGIAISLWAYVGYGIRYSIPALITTVFLNLFMFAVGLKVGPQFLAGLRRDGVRGVAVALVVVTLNFALALAGAKLFALGAGCAPGLISGSMTDTAVIGVATSAVESGAFKPPANVAAADVAGNIAAAYAVTYLFSLIGIILLVRYLPRVLGVDMKAAARAAEEGYGGADGAVPKAGTTGAYMLERLPVDVRAYRIDADEVVGMPVNELSIRAHVPVLRIVRGTEVLDPAANPSLRKGDVVTVVAGVAQLVTGGARLGAEVADERARSVDLEVADLVVTARDFDGLTLQEASERVRTALFGTQPFGRLFYVVALIREGIALPIWPGARISRGDIVRVIGQTSRIEQVGKLVGATVRVTTESDILTLALGLSIGYVIGTFSVTIGHIPVGLGAPAGVMLSGIVISALRSRYPLFGGPVSEGARSLLQTLGLDVFIAVVAVNTAASVAGAFTGGYVGALLGIGLVAGLLPPIVAWFVGRSLLGLNPAYLLGAICGARHSTPGLRAAQEECGSAVPAIGYPVAYAVSSVLVLVLGYLSLFL